MNEYWIIGAGKFGRQALNVLAERRRGNCFVVVDKDRAALDRVRSSRAETICADGIDFLERRLANRNHPDWIVPCLPVHLAFEWVRRQLESTHALELLPIPEAVRKALPHPFEGNGGELYISYADFVCPDDCPEPADICTVTGRPRPAALYNSIAGFPARKVHPVVVRSRQLSPGVGGYQPQALFDALEQVRVLSGTIVLATACRCHGVLHVFRLFEKPSPKKSG